MSKITEQLQRIQDVKEEYYYKFMDFIYDNLVNSELSDDIDKLEETRQRNSTKRLIYRQTYDTKLSLKQYQLQQLFRSITHENYKI